MSSALFGPSDGDATEQLADIKVLLQQVLRSPTNHQGIRSHDGVPCRYEAKRLDTDLLDKIKVALGIPLGPESAT